MAHAFSITCNGTTTRHTRSVSHATEQPRDTRVQYHMQRNYHATYAFSITCNGTTTRHTRAALYSIEQARGIRDQYHTQWN